MKPEIYYVDIAKCVLNQRANVLLREHHRLQFSGLAWVETSRVVRLIRKTPEGPVFETLNSIYAPYPAEAPNPFMTLKRTARKESA